MTETPKKPDEKKKGIVGKIKEAAEDKEGQLEILSTFVRLGILIWSGTILTLAYIKPPDVLGIPEQKFDPTFIASVFTGVLATFGVQAGKKAGANGGGIGKADLQKLIDAAAQTAPSQTIRIEQGPIKLSGEPPVVPPTK